MVWEPNLSPGGRAQCHRSGQFPGLEGAERVFESLASFADGRAVLDNGGLVEELAMQYVTFDLCP